MTTMLPLQYAPHPVHGTVHLVPDHDPTAPTRTLCGLPVTGAWSLGDETLSGHAATCGGCLRYRGARLAAAGRLDAPA